MKKIMLFILFMLPLASCSTNEAASDFGEYMHQYEGIKYRVTVLMYSDSHDRNVEFYDSKKMRTFEKGDTIKLKKTAQNFAKKHCNGSLVYKSSKIYDTNYVTINFWCSKKAT